MNTFMKCSEICLFDSSLELSVQAKCDRTHVPERPVSCLNGNGVIDLRLHQSTAAICEHLCIKRSDEWAEKREDVKKEHLCPLAYCFSTLSSFILATPHLVRYTGAVSPTLTVSLCGTLCYFLGCVFVLTVVLQAGRAPAADVSCSCSRWNRAAHCTGCTGGAQAAIWASLLPSLNQTVCCHSCSVWPSCSLHHSFLHPSLWASH